MKAVICRSYDGLEAATLEDIPTPALTPGAVKIGVRACAASFASLLVMEGKHQNKAPLPFTPGTEVAGEVLEVDTQSELFKVGDRVIAGVKSGGYAEQVVVPERSVFHLPDDIDFDSGAHFPTIYATAYAALCWRARVCKGEWVLVHGAAGGSGLAAIEVAKALGGKVIATAGSDTKLKTCVDHGADHAINYATEDWVQRVKEITHGRGADIIYDPVGGDIFDRSLKCIAPDGRIIPMGFASGVIPTIPANIALVKNITVIGLYWGYYVGWGRVPPTESVDSEVRKAFSILFDWVKGGLIRPHTYRIFDLSDFKDALKAIASREVNGRIIMRP